MILLANKAGNLYPVAQGPCKSNLRTPNLNLQHRIPNVQCSQATISGQKRNRSQVATTAAMVSSDATDSNRALSAFENLEVNNAPFRPRRVNSLWLV